MEFLRRLHQYDWYNAIKVYNWVTAEFQDLSRLNLSRELAAIEKAILMTWKRT